MMIVEDGDDDGGDDDLPISELELQHLLAWVHGLFGGRHHAIR